jgi:hypothetical protein
MPQTARASKAGERHRGPTGYQGKTKLGISEASLPHQKSQAALYGRAR